MKRCTYKMKKAAGGLKDISGGEGTGGGIAAGAGLVATGAQLAEGPPVDSQGIPKGGSAVAVLGSAASGAAMGAQIGGPWGAVVGGVVGTGVGLVGSAAADKARKEAQERQARMMQQRNWNRVGLDQSSQVSQYQKGAKHLKGQVLEMEGGEPHFSAKQGDGKRVLKAYAPHGPSHKEGGIPVLAQEGDAIVTTKKGLGKKAVAAQLAGDTKTVEKIIQQMPKDKGTSTARNGKRRVMPGSAFAPFKQTMAADPELQAQYNNGISSGKAFDIQHGNNLYRYAATPQATPGIQPLAAGGLGSLNSLLPGTLNPLPSSGTPAPLAPTPSTSATPSTPITGEKEGSARVGKVMGGVAQALPSIYNMSQGLFGSVDTTTRRGISPDLNHYEDLSQPQRRASRQGMRNQVANARNLSGGSAGNARSNAAAAYADNVSAQGAIDAQESSRKLAINTGNVGLLNGAKEYNARMNERADEADLQNAAKKSEALSKGLEGISSLAANQQLMSNQQASDKWNMQMLSQSINNYEIGPDGKTIQVKKKKKPLTSTSLGS